MTNTQYIEKIISSVDRILVDTSTLMSPGFQQFVFINKDTLFSLKKKLIVPKAVYTELARLMGSTNSEKAEHAMAAVELLSLNKDIFSVESAPLTEEEIAHAFADAQLLSELTIHKSDSNQLLLTNDKKLSCDAYDLNQQQSCKGRKVLVCYINWYGEMQCCECARTSVDKPAQNITFNEDEQTIADNKVQDSVFITEESQSWKFDWKSGVIGITGVGILYGLFKGSKALLRFI